MGMYYSKSKKKVYIDWDEKTKSGVEHWHGDFTPIHVFYHPKNSKIVRIRVKGKMPKWVERFAASHKFKAGATSDDKGKQGFWLANWKAWDPGEKPISSPNLNGSINQFIKMIPSELKDIKDKVKDNEKVIKENLMKNPSFFEDVGVFYKAEAIEGKSGTLLIDNDVFPDKDDLEDEEYARLIEAEGKLDKVVFELTNPVPEPIEDVEEESEESDEEITFEFEDDLTFSEEDALDNFSLEEEELNEEEENDLGEMELTEDNLEFGEDEELETADEITLIDDEELDIESDENFTLEEASETLNEEDTTNQLEEDTNQEIDKPSPDGDGDNDSNSSDEAKEPEKQEATSEDHTLFDTVSTEQEKSSTEQEKTPKKKKRKRKKKQIMDETIPLF